MGFWVPQPRLNSSESLRWKQAANRTQGGRSVGGRLFITNERLVFQPNRFDSVTGGRSWSVGLSGIAGVRARQRAEPLLSEGLFSGGIRKRLQLDLTSGETELFVVNRLPELIGVIEKAVVAKSPD